MVEYIGENYGFDGSGDGALIEWYGQWFRKLRIFPLLGICAKFS